MNSYKYFKIFLALFLSSFPFLGNAYRKIRSYDDIHGYGIHLGVGSSLLHKQKSENYDMSYRMAGFGDYSISDHLKFRGGISYSFLPFQNKLKFIDKILKVEIDSIEKHDLYCLGIPFGLKIHFFGIQNGFSLNIEIEPLFKLSNSVLIKDDYKIAKILSIDIKEDKDEMNKKKIKAQKGISKYLISLNLGLEYEFKSIGLILLLRTGGSLNNCITEARVNDLEKIDPEYISKNKHFTLGFAILNIGYNFAHLF